MYAVNVINSCGLPHNPNLLPSPDFFFFAGELWDFHSLCKQDAAPLGRRSFLFFACVERTQSNVHAACLHKEMHMLATNFTVQVNVEASEEDWERSRENSSCSQLSLDEVLQILQRHRRATLDGFDHHRGEK